MAIDRMGLLWVRTLTLSGLNTNNCFWNQKGKPPIPASNQLVGDTIVHQRILCTALMYSDHCFNVPPNATSKCLPFSSTSDLHVWICLWLTQWTHMHMTKCSFYRTFSKNSASLIFGIPNNHVMKFPRPSPSVFAYCKRSKTGGVEGLGTRLQPDPM